MNDILRKLNVKNPGQTVLVLNAPKVYEEVIAGFEGEVHREAADEAYPFVQVFGTSNEELRNVARQGAAVLEEDGLLWLCYPKKTSKTYKGSDCSRESVAVLLADQGFEPVRQVALDDDWSALRFRKAEHIKTMMRKSAVTAEGKKRIEQ